MSANLKKSAAIEYILASKNEVIIRKYKSYNIRGHDNNIFKSYSIPSNIMTEKKPEQIRLEFILDKVVEENLGLYPNYSIRKVRKVAKHIDTHPGMNVPYRHLTRIEDLQLYLKIRPEWHGKNVSELMKQHKDGYSFYTYVRSFAKKMSCGDEKIRSEIVRKVFPGIENRSEKKYNSLDDQMSDYEAYHDG